MFSYAQSLNARKSTWHKWSKTNNCTRTWLHLPWAMLKSRRFPDGSAILPVSETTLKLWLALSKRGWWMPCQSFFQCGWQWILAWNSPTSETQQQPVILWKPLFLLWSDWKIWVIYYCWIDQSFFLPRFCKLGVFLHNISHHIASFPGDPNSSGASVKHSFDASSFCHSCAGSGLLSTIIVLSLWLTINAHGTPSQTNALGFLELFLFSSSLFLISVTTEHVWLARSVPLSRSVSSSCDSGNHRPRSRFSPYP